MITLSANDTYQFLIQSDFITQASREDVFHSVRNEHLLSGVAETFRDAVLKFCDHPSLQYQWMRYLPSNSISDEFWKTLQPKIIYLLRNTCCLRPWSETSLCLPRQLHWVTSDFKDKNGELSFSRILSGTGRNTETRTRERIKEKAKAAIYLVK